MKRNHWIVGASMTSSNTNSRFFPYGSSNSVRIVLAIFMDSNSRNCRIAGSSNRCKLMGHSGGSEISNWWQTSLRCKIYESKVSFLCEMSNHSTVKTRTMEGCDATSAAKVVFPLPSRPEVMATQTSVSSFNRSSN